MVTIAPFRAVRPSKLFQEQISISSPAIGSNISQIHLNYNQHRAQKRLIQDAEENLYIYKQTKLHSAKSYTGMIANTSIDDYLNGTIKTHEKTLETREQFFRELFTVCNFSSEPVLVTHPDNEDIKSLINLYTAKQADFEYTENEISHQLWLVNNIEHVNTAKSAFLNCSNIYIADGHHRSASSVFVGQNRRNQNVNQTGAESFNYFMCLFMSFSELEVFSINRVVKDLNGKTTKEFLLELQEDFYVDSSYTRQVTTSSFEMYLDGCWYHIITKENVFNATDPVKSLATHTLATRILSPLLSLNERAAGNRIEYVNGQEDKTLLEQKVDSGMAAVAFLLQPITIRQIQSIADADQTMPPKTTWVEPKIQNG
eukprot:CAMPEP_0206206608 /NCGR_PEP_ID=MMETSP0166-20121206/15066_1 /ASSEMBLY_ACC=CAM_ASM_000260 /TAXON_ID=95228 /ORGANISM="Vannella robusta, Strain DIVA3 518/3/11/1/6" /LENGTH=370 /DNA_ID=CAMNT_0053627149 /DNA_START=9 /DNA_END=1117 /DNA_ORIENTATION=+